MDMEFLVCSDESVVDLGSNDDCTTLNALKATELHITGTMVKMLYFVMWLSGSVG